MADDVVHDSVVAAALDVLGTGALLKEDASALSAANACEGFVGTVITARHMYTEPDTNSDSVELYEHGMYFGDSMYVFGNPSEPEEKQCLHLVVLCAFAVWNGIYSLLSIQKKSYAPRVGICRGTVRWREFTTSKHKHVFPIGTSMANAHRLEESQLWVGGALSADVALDNHQYVIDYPVPLKDDEGSWTGAAIAVNWIAMAEQDDRYDLASLVSDLRAHADQQTQSGARLKWENTLKFAETMLQ